MTRYLNCDSSLKLAKCPEHQLAKQRPCLKQTLKDILPNTLGAEVNVIKSFKVSWTFWKINYNYELADLSQ